MRKKWNIINIKGQKTPNSICKACTFFTNNAGVAEFPLRYIHTNYLHYKKM